MSDCKLVAITGASQGIGASIATRLAADGYNLLLIGRNREKLSAVSNNIVNLNHRRADIFSCDLTKDSDITLLLSHLSNIDDQLYALINNAGGVSIPKVAADLDIEEWRETFELNFFSCMRLSLAALKKMECFRLGRIVNISSINAQEPGYFNPHYSAAKASLNNFSKYLSNVAAKAGVTVNTVSPGIIETDQWVHNVMLQYSNDLEAREALDKELERIRNVVPVGRTGRPEEIAHLVSLLLSPEGDFINGANFVIDGGKKRSV